MVVPLRLKSKQYFQCAHEAGRDAAHATDALKRSNFQHTEQRWLRLAASYERSERLSRLLDDTCGWLREKVIVPGQTPASVPEPEAPCTLTGHPRCATCAVPMWVVSVEEYPGNQQRAWLFECKICHTKLAFTQRATLLEGDEQLRAVPLEAPTMPRGPTLTECFGVSGSATFVEEHTDSNLPASLTARR